MIGIFRAYNPLTLIWMALLLFVLRVGYAFQLPDQTHFVLLEPYVQSVFPLNYHNFLSPGANVLVAALVVFIQAVLLNYLVNSNNLLGKPSFLPGLMYITVTGLFTDFLVLSPALICNFFLIWMMFKVINLYKAEDAKALSYDLGLLVAAGTLIYFPYIYLIISVWIAIAIFRPFDWRDYMASLIGFATVFFFLAVFYYLNNQLNSFYKIWLPLGTKFPSTVKIDYYDYLVLVPVLIILFLGTFKLQENFFRSYVLIRKVFQLLFFIFLIAGASFYVKSRFALSHFVLCAVPVAIFFSYYFLYAGKKWVYESLYIILIAAIIYFQFNTF
ncbi:hypothetical protein GCM10027037_32660 [Mucilaginibacter koreensis]